MALLCRQVHLHFSISPGDRIARQEQGDPSCWEQILLDDPNWTYLETWTEEAPTMEIEFEYNDS